MQVEDTGTARCFPNWATGVLAHPWIRCSRRWKNWPRCRFTKNWRLDVVNWIQGTAATPYLEKGKVTSLADPATITRLDRTFGGFRFFGFAMWFN
jgi:hypothetical protein